MKKTFLKYFSIVAFILVIACNESEDLVTDGAQIGGLLDASSQSINYVVGYPEGPYTIEFLVHQSKKSVKSVKLYKSFVTNIKYTEIVEGEEVEKDTTIVSNEILDRTLDVTESGNYFLATEYTLDELVAGLEVGDLDGNLSELPTDDGLYQIGDQWVFRIESIMDDGRVVQQSYTVSIGVSTRYAGTYKAADGAYYRLGAKTYSTADWPAEISIQSVDATTYRVLEYWGPFDGNEWYFQIVNGEITYPEGQLINGYGLITCESNPGDFVPEVHCDNSNYVINDDVGGKDKLVLTNGYYTTGTAADGPRVMYQVLEKIVE